MSFLPVAGDKPELIRPGKKWPLQERVTGTAECQTAIVEVRSESCELTISSSFTGGLIPQFIHRKKNQRQACCDASMAHTIQDTTLSPEATGQEVKAKVVESEGGVVGDVILKEGGTSSSPTPSGDTTNSQSDKASIATPSSAQNNVPTNRPSLVPLGSNSISSSSSTPVAPHPKRFSAMNINKKFLEKNSTASGSQAISAASSISKSGSPITRPTMQPTSSHPRLVTAKLTANPIPSSSNVGWSRPSSVAPSTATANSSPNSSSPLPIAATPQGSVASLPQLPHVGKVIQPQPRSAMVQLSSQQKEPVSNKPVWGNIKPSPAAIMRPDIEPTDFPTAAEVANVNARKHAKPEDTKLASESAAKQARLEEADTFRGVHLDPNAHHWDEMEGDDDDFLGGVIEFGDGRQYKVEANEVTESAQQEESSAGPHVSKENRFVDDYDRSWPKSQSSPASSSKEVPPVAISQPKGIPTSPISPHPNHSPHDASRVLFNERSNRLEPYSRQAQPPFPSKRPGYQEGKDVQLLQKPSSSDYNARNRRMSGSSGSYGPAGANGGFSGDKFRDRESNTRRDAPPLSPRATKDQHMEPLGDRGRKSSMGPPPVPFAGNRRPSDGGRQLPPHLSQVSPNIPPRRLPSRDSRISPSEVNAANPSPTNRFPPISPAVSHASLVLVSPKQGPAVLLPLNAPELDDARKDVMQTAAARAKQRRQQEEAEREAQKERARRKAVEMEEKMKAADAERQKQAEQEISKEREAAVVIEDAIQSVSSQKSLAEGKVHEGKPGLQRPPSLKPVNRESATAFVGGRRTGSFSARVPPSPSAPTPASQQESWRSRVQPAPAPPAPAPYLTQPTSPTKPQRPSAFNATPSALEQVETIAGGSTDQLEVVDFSEMDKFVHSTKDDSETIAPATATTQEVAPAILSKPPRPVASDFFEEPQSPSAKKNDFASWRRKVSVSLDTQPVAVKASTSSPLESGPSGDKPPSPQNTRSPKEHPDTSSNVLQPVAATKEALVHAENGGQIVQVSIQNNTQRTPRGQTFYNDAAMSSLDDAMSRIKGVLVGMQSHDLSKPKEVHQTSPPEHVAQPARPPHLNVPSSSAAKVSNRDRWVPPALRSRKSDDNNEEPRELSVTVLEPPHSPAPELSAFRICLPSSSRRLDQIPYFKLHAFKKAVHVRLDTLSFVPYIPEMSRNQDLNINNVLFRKPYKGNFKYVVRLPRHRGPRSFIPGGPGKPGSNTFGRPTVADESASWRKPTTAQGLKLAEETEPEPSSTQELDTTSRSPPPEPTPKEVVITSIPKPADISPTKSESNQGVRARSQPKMPVGSAVAFLRDSRIDVVDRDVQTSVKFIVGSELEVAVDETVADVVKPSSSSVGTEPNVDVPSRNTVSPVSVPLDLKDHSTSLRFQVAKTDSKSSDDSTDRILLTPPNQHATPWSKTSTSIPVKESPARGPDPEHLKAVWSQTSNKGGLHSVNSLEGINDDLTGIPFTLQEVKSEDGATPPPSLPSAPSRMSLHEVTKAFQQVPTSSTSSAPLSHREAISPPLTTAPVARPTSTNTPYSYSPSPQNSMRPAYAYPSPMMNHTPSVMYSHPVSASPIPSRMQINGQHPQYPQQMWMPMPPPQGPGMMRPVPSPYPAQMMHYPPPGYAPQGPPNMMGPGPQPPNVGRGRNMPVMSPAMSHAHAHPAAGMYGGSPVMHPAMPQNHGYMPMPPAGRGQPRPEGNQMSHSQHHANHAPHGGFNHVPNSSYVRPTW